MAAYVTITGDTFELIARKQYGTEQESSRIARANPGLSEPFTEGTTLNIPPIPDAPQNQSQNAPSENLNEVAVLIDGERFRFWNAVKITRSIDSMDTVMFGAPFEPDAPGFRDTFRPFSFKPLTVTVGGAPLFTGTMVNVDPILANQGKVISVTGYSLPGVLNDCNAPASSYPIEFFDQTLQAIAESMAGAFGLSVEFIGDPGPVFDPPVSCGTTKKVLSFLADLARQRNRVIGSTPRGALLFPEIVEVGQPVAVLTQGESPVLSVTPMFNPQAYFSHITGMQPTFLGFVGSQFTVKNPFLTGVLRPYTFDAPDTTDADVSVAVNAQAVRMFWSMAGYSVEVPTWRDPSGAFWAPNTTIKLTAPGAMIYSSYEFLIRSVDFTRNSTATTATLNLVLSGKIPEVLPWD